MNETHFHILIADDQTGVRHMLAMMFQEAAYVVHLAEDGPQALAMAQELVPDLILLDVMMPGMSGYDVAEKLRQTSETADTPIIMLSAKGQVPDKVRGFEAGADDYVTKPVAREELLARAKALIHRSQRDHGQTAVKAKVVCVLGAKGGVGATSVALNLAAALNAKGKTSLLAELQTAPSSALPQLGMTIEHDLGELTALEPEKWTRSAIMGRIGQHVSGIRLLPAPQEVGTAVLPPLLASRIIKTAITGVDFLFLNPSPTYNETTREAIRQSNLVLLVTEPDKLNVKIAQSRLDVLKKWAQVDKVQIVTVTRTPSAALVGKQALTEQLGRPIVGSVPPGPEAFQQAAVAGKPLILVMPQATSA
ncbi:MAG: response regulator, partial [Anaerolineae bacterium]